MNNDRKIQITAHKLSSSQAVEEVKNTFESMLDFDKGIYDVWGDFKNLFTVAKDTAVEIGEVAYDAGVYGINPMNNLMQKIEQGASSLYAELQKQTEIGSVSYGAPTYTWVLPLPNTMDDDFSHSYSGNTLTVADRMLMKGSHILAKAISPVSGLNLETATQMYIDVAKRNNVVLNPEKITTYDGTNLRKYNFVFNLIAQDEEHYKKILQGLIAFKYHMAGEATKSSLFIKQKSVFKIEFLNKHLQEMAEIKDATFNLTDINITYGADGNFSINNQGAVKHIRLALSFTERTPYYENTNKGSGVVK